MTTTNDRLTEIRARLDAATPAPWTRFGRNAAAPDEDDWFLGHDVHGPPAAQRGQIERVADAELIAHAPDDLAHLLELVEQLQGQLDEARAENARPAAQERASGPETPQGHPSESTAVPGRPGPVQGSEVPDVDGWTIYPTTDGGLMVSHDTDADRPTLGALDSIPLAAVLAFIADAAEETPEPGERTE